MNWFSYTFVPYCHDPILTAVFPATFCRRQLESRVIDNLTVYEC